MDWRLSSESRINGGLTTCLVRSLPIRLQGPIMTACASAKGILAALALAWGACPCGAEARTIAVRRDGAGDFRTIQQAVAAACPGDTVEVSPGIYGETGAAWAGPYGRQDWKAVFRTVRAGSPRAPITIKAKLPARQPLNGGEWAGGDSQKETILEGRSASGARLPACALLLHSWVVLDGFVVRGGGRHGVCGSRFGISKDTAARGLWVRNCKFLSDAAGTKRRERLGENSGGLALGGWAVPECCVQNNYFETGHCTALAIVGGTNGVVEYNEFRDWNCYALYAHGGTHANDGLIVRYNYFHPPRPVPLMRLRDSVGYEVHHNVVVGPSSGIYLDDHDGNFPDDGYVAHHNTLLLKSAAYAIGYQRPSHAKGRARPTAYNIIAGKARCAVNPSVWGAPFSNLHVTHNVVAPGIPIVGGKGLDNGTRVVADNIVVDPKLDGHFKSLAVDNEKYGANLDVQEIPYRKFSGKLYAFHDPHAGKAAEPDRRPRGPAGGNGPARAATVPAAAEARNHAGGTVVRKGEPMPVFPAPVVLEATGGVRTIGVGARVVVAAGDPQLAWAAQMLSRELGQALGAPGDRLKLVAALELAGASRAGDILLGTATSSGLASAGVGDLARKLAPRSGAYVLRVSPKGVAILGRDDAGVFYGVLTLLQLFRKADAGTGQVPCANVVDAPYHQYRGMRAALPRGIPRKAEVTHAYYRDLLRLMAFARLNHVWVQGCSWCVPLKRHKEMNWSNVLTTEQAGGVVDFARRHFLSMDGSLDFTWLYYDYKHLAEIPAGETWESLKAKVRRMSRVNPCPSHPEMWKVATEVMDDTMAVLPGDHYAVPLDEMYQEYHGSRWGVCPRCKGKDPVRLWVDMANRLIAHVLKRGRTPILGGGMLMYEHQGWYKDIYKAIDLIGQGDRVQLVGGAHPPRRHGGRGQAAEERDLQRHAVLQETRLSGRDAPVRRPPLAGPARDARGQGPPRLLRGVRLILPRHELRVDEAARHTGPAGVHRSTPLEPERPGDGLRGRREGLPLRAGAGRRRTGRQELRGSHRAGPQGPRRAAGRRRAKGRGAWPTLRQFQ
ncbi:MAG: hypothetical protein AMK72_14205 [Planctomycetes bacterium SM23_25]|nr:MAG: hypothetical protein AMK72_14205 [Planctomycetes bacterium SM23_25]